MRCRIIPPSVQDNIERNIEGAEKARARKNRLLSARVHGMRLLGASLPTAYEPGHQEKREIRDAQNSTREDGPTVRLEDTPDTGDVFIDHIYDAVGYVYDYLVEVHGREGFDGLGGRFLSIIHYSEGSGGWDNAAYYRNPTLGMLELIGDGDIFPPFHLSPGIHAHEGGHAVTESTCNLGYGNDEDGGMNEFGSDALCVLSEMWRLRQTAGQYHWYIAPELFSMGLRGQGLRDCLIIERGPAFDDPVLGQDQQILTYDQYRRGQDPHITSSIGNGWLAWAARQMPDRFAWETIGPIWFEAWSTGRMTPRGGYQPFARLTEAIAIERHGLTSPIVEAVRYGWDKVKVPIPTGPTPDPTPEPTPDASACTDAEIAALARVAMPAIQSALRTLAAHPVGRRLLATELRAFRNSLRV